MQQIYLVPHSHYDAAWALTKEDYLYINIESILKKAVELIGKTVLCFNGSRTVSFGRKCDTSSQGRYNKTKPGGVTTWKEIRVDG